MTLWGFIKKEWQTVVILSAIAGFAFALGGKKITYEYRDKELSTKIDSVAVKIDRLTSTQADYQQFTNTRLDRIERTQIATDVTISDQGYKQDVLIDSYLRYILTGQKDILALIKEMSKKPDLNIKYEKIPNPTE